MAPEQFLRQPSTRAATSSRSAWRSTRRSTASGRSRATRSSRSRTGDRRPGAGRAEGKRRSGLGATGVLRGLAPEPNRGFAGVDELRAVLADGIFPIVDCDEEVIDGRSGRRAGQWGDDRAATFCYRFFLKRPQEMDRRQVAEHVGAASASLAEAATRRTESKALRDRALAAFDGFAREEGEELWAKGLAASKVADDGYERGIKRLEAAVTLAPRRDLRDRIADALLDQAQMDGRTDGERQSILRRLAVYDDGARVRGGSARPRSCESIPIHPGSRFASSRTIGTLTMSSSLRIPSAEAR